MEFKKVTVIYFSPTGNSKKYASEIAKRFDINYKELNITDYNTRRETHRFKNDELVVFSAPVYYGRLPMVNGNIFENVQGQNTPAIFTVTYGNREFEDSLLELQNICEERGFHGIAGGAFIGPHKFSKIIAPNRPNEEDYKVLDDFVDKIKQTKDLKEVLKVSGDYPYKKVEKMPFVPIASDDCTKCGFCESICPVRAISKGNYKDTNSDLCIACFACVKQCPQHARGIDEHGFRQKVNMLEENLTKVDKKPELFYL